MGDKVQCAKCKRKLVTVFTVCKCHLVLCPRCRPFAKHQCKAVNADDAPLRVSN